MNQTSSFGIFFYDSTQKLKLNITEGKPRMLSSRMNGGFHYYWQADWNNLKAA